MKKVMGAALAAALILEVGAAAAQTKSTGTSRIRLARAHCTTGPCDPFFTFQGGAVLLKRGRQPKLVLNRKLGTARINALQQLGGVPIPAALDLQLSGTIFYGQDQNAVCTLANTPVSGTFATSTMNCTIGAAGAANCNGPLAFIDFTAPECSDVQQTIQGLTVEIYEGGFVGTPERLLATGGMNILGKSPDCASGGAGCP
jgi:hypothetical protein